MKPLPLLQTAGCWPDLGEMDILEMINGDGFAHGTYHWEDNYPAKNCTEPNGHLSVTSQEAIANWDTDYHEYALERGGDYLVYIYDGKVVANFSGNTGQPKSPKLWPVPFYLILNTAVGGPWPGPPNATTAFPTYHVLDYVRVAVRSDAASIALT